MSEGFRKLPKTEFGKVEALFATLDDHLAIRSILAGLSPAEIYVDDKENPKTALTWFKRRVFLAGDTSNPVVNRSLKHLLTDTYLKYARELKLEKSVFTLFYTSGWETIIDFVMKDKIPSKRSCYYYHLPSTKTVPQAQIVPEFKLRLVDADLLVDRGIRNINYVENEMVSERLSVIDFLEKSFGFCVIHEGEIAGWCMSEYNTGYRCEIGIETAPDYRRRGLATWTASEVIRRAREGGITEIGWHCSSDNLPSIATAEKLGFERMREFPVYSASFDVLGSHSY